MKIATRIVLPLVVVLALVAWVAARPLRSRTVGN